MDFEKVLSLLVEKFTEGRVDFALIGGFALHAAGYTRATNDIDFLIAKEDASKAGEIMTSHGYQIRHETDDVCNFSNPVAPLGTVDFLYARRKHARAILKRAAAQDMMGGRLKVRVVAPEDLIGLKVQSSSNDPERYHQDLADIESILRLNKNRLNLDLVREYFTLFDRENELDAILERLNHAQ